MKLPITKPLVEYLSGLNVTSTELIRKGVPRDALYRALRRDIDFMSEDNAAKLASAIGMSTDTLLAIALQGQAAAGRMGDGVNYNAVPAELAFLQEAWPDLSISGRECIMQYAEYVISREREARREKKNEENSKSA